MSRDKRDAGAPVDDRYRRSNRVLVSELGPRARLVGPEAHHLRDVLRLKAGDPVEAFDGRGSIAGGAILSLSRDAVELALGEPQPSRAEAPLRLTLAVALLKGDKLADVVRPATELGVHSFTLLKTAYADVDDLPPSRRSRLVRIAEEAARQCGRATVPQVYGPISLSDLVAELAQQAEPTLIVVTDPRASHSLAEATAALAAEVGTGSVVVVTGPEGGLSAEEVKLLERAGALPVGLGPRILRAETAPVALAAALLLGAG